MNQFVYYLKKFNNQQYQATFSMFKKILKEINIIYTILLEIYIILYRVNMITLYHVTY